MPHRRLCQDPAPPHLRLTVAGPPPSSVGIQQQARGRWPPGGGLAPLRPPRPAAPAHGALRLKGKMTGGEVGNRSELDIAPSPTEIVVTYDPTGNNGRR